MSLYTTDFVEIIQSIQKCGSYQIPFMITIEHYSNLTYFEFVVFIFSLPAHKYAILKNNYTISKFF